MVDTFATRNTLSGVQESACRTCQPLRHRGGDAVMDRLLRLVRHGGKSPASAGAFTPGRCGAPSSRPVCFEQIRQQPRAPGAKSSSPMALQGLIPTEGSMPSATQAKRYDCGRQGFLEATVEFAFQHPQVGANFRDYLRALTV